MQEIVCAHKWGTEGTFWNETKKDYSERYRICKCCREVWMLRDPEPRVVIGKVEESHPKDLH